MAQVLMEKLSKIKCSVIRFREVRSLGEEQKIYVFKRAQASNKWGELKGNKQERWADVVAHISLQKYLGRIFLCEWARVIHKLESYIKLINREWSKCMLQWTSSYSDENIDKFYNVQSCVSSFLLLLHVLLFLFLSWATPCHAHALVNTMEGTKTADDEGNRKLTILRSVTDNAPAWWRSPLRFKPRSFTWVAGMMSQFESLVLQPITGFHFILITALMVTEMRELIDYLDSISIWDILYVMLSY